MSLVLRVLFWISGIAFLGYLYAAGCLLWFLRQHHIHRAGETHPEQPQH